jgi:tetratricopeptide (TPR) repeat protein
MVRINRADGLRDNEGCLTAMTEELTALMKKGKALVRANRYEDAKEVFREALAIAEKSFGLEALELILPLRLLAIATTPPPDQDPGHHAEALQLNLRALYLFEKHSVDDPPFYERLLDNIGYNWGCQKEYDKALEYMHRSLAVAEREYGESRGLVLTLVGFIELLLQADRPHEAIPFAERYLRLSPSRHAHLDLGRCLMAAGRNAEALYHLERCRDMTLASKPGASGPLMLELQAWIEQLRKRANDDEG